MRSAAIVALVLVGGGLLAHILLADPGYVAIRLGSWLFETTAPVFLLILAAAYIVARTISSAVGARRRMERIRSERRKRRARDDTQRGLLQLAAGNWKSAEELLTRSAEDADSPAANYLVAARAADLLDAVERRDEWLARAEEKAPESRAAALVTLAEMQMRRGQDEQALQTLEQLDASGELNSRGLELMARLCRKLGRNEQLQALGPRLRAAKELPEQQVSEMLAQAALEGIREIGERGDAEALGKAWSDLPRAQRRLPHAIVTHARAAIACHDHAAAERELRDLIGDTFDPQAVRLYGDVVLPDPLGPLTHSQEWLRKRPDDPDLLVTCARHCVRAELLGKARGYLEKSLALRPGIDNALLLSELLEQLGERDNASRVLREAVMRNAGRRSALPRVKLRRR